MCLGVILDSCGVIIPRCGEEVVFDFVVVRIVPSGDRDVCYTMIINMLFV